MWTGYGGCGGGGSGSQGMSGGRGVEAQFNNPPFKLREFKAANYDLN